MKIEIKEDINLSGALAHIHPDTWKKIQQEKGLSHLAEAKVVLVGYFDTDVYELVVTSNVATDTLFVSDWVKEQFYKDRTCLEITRNSP